MRTWPRRLSTLGVVIASLAMSGCEANRYVSGWIPNWGATDGQAVIADSDAARVLTEVSPFWYAPAADGSVYLIRNPVSLANTVTALRAAGLPVLPSIATTPLPFDFANTSLRAQHVSNIVSLVVANGYDGIDIDYEFVFSSSGARAYWPTIKPLWISFVTELATALHARGKLLSVTVPPVWNGGASGYTVYALPEIAPHVDRLRLMVYDWSMSTPGPIAPGWWVDSVIAYSSTVVPPAKLQLGVPAYGRHWAKQAYPTEVCPADATFTDSIEMGEIAGLVTRSGTVPGRDVSGEVTFSWTEIVSGPLESPVVPPAFVPPPTTVSGAGDGVVDGGLRPAHRLWPHTQATCTIRHTVYAPDATTMRIRAEAALAAGWSGIAVWAIGYETLDTYDQLVGLDAGRPGGDPYGALDVPSVQGTQVKVTGYALDPEFDLPVPVRITVTKVPSGTVATTLDHAARATRSAMPSGLGPFHGIDATFALSPGSYSVCASVVAWGGGVGPSLGCRSFTVVGTLSSPSVGSLDV